LQAVVEAVVVTYHGITYGSPGAGRSLVEAGHQLVSTIHSCRRTVPIPLQTAVAEAVDVT
jgi:hypothetical protein